MSAGAHNYAHHYNGSRPSRGSRLRSKLGRTISLRRLEQLLHVEARKGVSRHMGNFLVEIKAVGGHGDDRKAQPGEALTFTEGSVDAIAKECVDKLKAAGASVESAKLVHWPGEESEVVDDLANGVRERGAFSP